MKKSNMYCFISTEARKEFLERIFNENSSERLNLEKRNPGFFSEWLLSFDKEFLRKLSTEEYILVLSHEQGSSFFDKIFEKVQSSTGAVKLGWLTKTIGEEIEFETKIQKNGHKITCRLKIKHSAMDELLNDPEFYNNPRIRIMGGAQNYELKYCCFY